MAGKGSIEAVRRRSIRALAWLAVPAAVAALLLLTSRGAPRLPADGDHTARTSEARCLTCHSFAGTRPRPADHPPRDDCFSCHALADGELRPHPGAPTSLPGGWRDDPGRRGSGAPAAR